MKNLPIALTLAVLGTTLVGSSATAQRRGFEFGRAGRAGGVLGRVPRLRERAGRQGHERRIFPRFRYAPYYSGFGYDSDLGLNPAYQPVPEVPPPQVLAEKPAPSVAPPAPSKPAEGPVLLELQGDNWVRITSDGPPQVVGQSHPSGPGTAPKPPAAAASTILVFRDGHQEEIGKYCIIDGMIHITEDYWSTGSWTRTVKILDLDVPATLKLNQKQGTRFRLPSGPYEVMIGG